MKDSMRNLLTATLACGFFLAAPALAAEWKIDSAHSNAGFAVKHMTISTVRGSFDKVSGSAQYDGKDVKSIKVNATIDAASIDTGDEGRDKHLRGADFFDVDKHPTITFVSKKATPAGKGKFKLEGDLTMHGVTKPVTLDVQGPTAAINDKHGNVKVGASATAKVNRKDFGISYGGLMDNGGAMIGEEVSINLDIELSQPVADKKQS